MPASTGHRDRGLVLDGRDVAGVPVERHRLQDASHDLAAAGEVAPNCALSIDGDAHSVEGLANLLYGVGVAPRACVGPRWVLNVLPLEELLACMKRQRR